MLQKKGNDAWHTSILNTTEHFSTAAHLMGEGYEALCCTFFDEFRTTHFNPMRCHMFDNAQWNDVRPSNEPVHGNLYSTS
jgi:hypothetical protein